MHMTSLHMTSSPMLSSVMETGSDQILKAVWSTVQWTVSLHIRAACKDKGWETLAHENISTENREQCKKLWCLSLQENPSLKCSKDEDKKWHAFFLLQMKLCLLHQEKHASYLQLIWTCESFYCQLLFFSIWPLEITLHNWTRKLSFFIWFWRCKVVNTGDWSGNELCIICKAIYRNICYYNQDSSWLVFHNPAFAKWGKV